MALFADDARIHLIDGQPVAIGAAAIRALYTSRFAHPALHCEVHTRMEHGAYAIDRETVSGLPTGAFEVIAIYEVRDGLIRSVQFIR